MVNLRSLVARLRAEQDQLTRRLKKVTRIIDALVPLAGKTIRRKYRMSKAARRKISRAKKAYWKKRAAKKLKIAA
jgi:hypothetical protein